MSFLARITLPLLAAAPALAAPRHLGGGGELDLSLGRLIFALLFCLGLAVIVALLLKRSGGKIDLAAFGRGFVALERSPRRLQLLEARRVSAHADLCLVRCDDREYLILSSAAQQQVIERRELGQ
ncbi:MAG: hypothetical protein K2X76_01670 [Sphingomonas sp.]|nr:hypothetical protein [Sphingomonas sp.]